MGAGKRQEPSTQPVEAEPHTVPQFPQLLKSEERDTHAPPQDESPPVHTQAPFEHLIEEWGSDRLASNLTRHTVVPDGHALPQDPQLNIFEPKITQFKADALPQFVSPLPHVGAG